MASHSNIPQNVIWRSDLQLVWSHSFPSPTLLVPWITMTNLFDPHTFHILFGPIILFHVYVLVPYSCSVQLVGLIFSLVQFVSPMFSTSNLLVPYVDMSDLLVPYSSVSDLFGPVIVRIQFCWSHIFPCPACWSHTCNLLVPYVLKSNFSEIQTVQKKLSAQNTDMSIFPKQK